MNLSASEQRRAVAKPEKTWASVANASRQFLLLTDAFLPHAGGSRVYYYNLYRRLAQDLQHSVLVLTTQTPGHENFDAQATFPSFRIKRRGKPLPDWRVERAFRVLLPFLRTIRFQLFGRADLLHAGDLFPQGLACVWMKKLFGTPYLIYAHGEEITQTDLYRYQAIVRDSIYRHADRVIAANDFARQHLLRIGVEESRIHTIYPGVDSVRFRPELADAAQAERLLTTGRTVILSVGRLVPHKGHRILLEAIAALPATTPRPRYLIAGEGPEAGALMAQVAELGLADDVAFLGKVTEGELPTLYNLCDLFALANCEHRGCVEGFGMVFLEAAACGKAVLAGRTGGTAGAVVDHTTGILFDPSKIEEVTSALNLMLSNSDLRRRMGAAGRERAVSTFSWENAARQLDAVCAEILVKTTSRSSHTYQTSRIFRSKTHHG
ncbi:MAG: glycosyltransferase family 4 protein [Acidobacteria bacterium]|nr:glycosyltransferase family 4 protein [Acidobacteriota bacterium]